MQKVQLFIEGNRVDLFKDSEISLNSSIQNIRDIAKVFTDFTKSFSVPASKNNNNIFQHFYNFNIEDGFDARIKKTASIELNYLPFKSGKIKLDSVRLKNNKPFYYKVTFFGNTVNLKDLFAEDKLEDIATTFFSQFDQVYTSTTALSALQSANTVSPYTDAVLIPLITNTTRLYYDSSNTSRIYDDSGTLQELGGNLYAPSNNTSSTNFAGVYYEELKYALRLHVVIKAIETHYGITFSTDFFNTSNTHYHGLYMWLHKEAGFTFKDTEESQVLINTFTTGTTTIVAAGGLAPAGTVVSDGSVFKLNSRLRRLSIDISLTSGSSTNPYSILIFKNGEQVHEAFIAADSSSPFTGTTTFDDLGNIFVDDEYQVFIKTKFALTFTTASFIKFTLTNLRTSPSAGSGNTTINLASSMSIGTNPIFIVQQNMPDIKVIDFLTSIFKMFNLTAFEQQDGTIKVQTLDSFYASSTTTWDLNKYLDKDFDVSPSLPFKEIDFGYEGLETFLANDHKERFGQEWGTDEYKVNPDESGLTFDAINNIYEVRPKIEHMKFERLIDNNNDATTDVQIGWCVNSDERPFAGKPILFYPKKITSGTNIRFLKVRVRADSSSHSDIDDYFIPSNSQELSASTSKNNINFKLEQNEYAFADNVDFSGTLFNEFYKKYVTKVYDKRNRLTTVKGKLPISFIINHTLADKIKFRNNDYLINNIKLNLNTGDATLELLNDIKISDFDFISNTPAVFASSACGQSDSDVTTKVYYDKTVDLANGSIVFDDESLGTEFSGNGSFYKFKLANKSASISSVGVISNLSDC